MYLNFVELVSAFNIFYMPFNGEFGSVYVPLFALYCVPE